MVVVFFTTDIEEVHELADRVVTIFRGSVCGRPQLCSCQHGRCPHRHYPRPPVTTQWSAQRDRHEPEIHNRHVGQPSQPLPATFSAARSTAGQRRQARHCSAPSVGVGDNRQLPLNGERQRNPLFGRRCRHCRGRDGLHNAKWQPVHAVDAVSRRRFPRSSSPLRSIWGCSRRSPLLSSSALSSGFFRGLWWVGLGQIRSSPPSPYLRSSWALVRSTRAGPTIVGQGDTFGLGVGNLRRACPESDCALSKT